MDKRARTLTINDENLKTLNQTTPKPKTANSKPFFTFSHATICLLSILKRICGYAANLLRRSNDMASWSLKDFLNGEEEPRPRRSTHKEKENCMQELYP